MSLTTILDLSGGHPELRKAAEVLLQAASDYWSAYRKATGGAAVVWVSDADGRLVVLTRGEYRSQIMHNIEILQRDGDQLRAFGDDPDGQVVR